MKCQNIACQTEHGLPGNKKKIEIAVIPWCQIKWDTVKISMRTTLEFSLDSKVMFIYSLLQIRGSEAEKPLFPWKRAEKSNRKHNLFLTDF